MLAPLPGDGRRRSIRVIKPFIGGGFGARVEVLNFEVITRAAGAGRPGQGDAWSLTREENFLTHRGRPQTHTRLKLGMRQGRPHHRLRVRGDAARWRLCRLWRGHDPLRRRAAARRSTTSRPSNTTATASTPTCRPAARCAAMARSTSATPSKCCSIAWRGELGLDPFAVRRANLLRGADADHQRPHGQQLRPGRMSGQGRAGERLARAQGRLPPGKGLGHGLLALRQRLGQAHPLDGRTSCA